MPFFTHMQHWHDASFNLQSFSLARVWGRYQHFMCLSQAIFCIPTKAQEPIKWGFQIQNLIRKHQEASSKFENLGWSKVYISFWLSYTIDRSGLGLLQMGKCQQSKSLKSWKAFVCNFIGCDMICTHCFSFCLII